MLRLGTKRKKKISRGETLNFFFCAAIMYIWCNEATVTRGKVMCTVNLSWLPDASEIFVPALEAALNWICSWAGQLNAQSLGSLKKAGFFPCRKLMWTRLLWITINWYQLKIIIWQEYSMVFPIDVRFFLTLWCAYNLSRYDMLMQAMMLLHNA